VCHVTFLAFAELVSFFASSQLLLIIQASEDLTDLIRLLIFSDEQAVSPSLLYFLTILHRCFLSPLHTRLFRAPFGLESNLL
jgi:hypothetical protein